MSRTEHLPPSAAALLDLPKEERIKRIQSPRWIGYTRAEKLLECLEELLVYPRTHRMPNLLIVGDTNNGKTMLVQRFWHRHAPDDNPKGEGAIVPVLYMQAPPIPDESKFYSAILELLFAPYRASDRVEKKQAQALKLLRYVGLKLLIIDEIHHILAGNLNKQRGFLNVIKFIGNELQVPVVGVGTGDAFRAIQTDPQLANRFDPGKLPRWQHDEDFLRMLVSFERMLPLRQASTLHDPAISSKLLSMSEGLIGELSRILVSAASQAVQSGEERITVKTLSLIDWISPSERKRQKI